MRIYDHVLKKKLTGIKCNGCGKILSVHHGVIAEDWLSVDKQWGYFSRKDGQTDSFDLCESCYDRIVKGFVLPVAHKETEQLWPDDDFAGE